MQSMTTILDQISNQMQQISGPNNKAENKNGSDFSTVLLNSISGINNMQNSARGLTEDYIAGKPDVGLNDVMVSLQKSAIALNFGVQMRNKIVNAYQEIMSMAV